MKKILSVAGIFLLIVSLLLSAAGLYLSRINPNKYKGRISQYVYAKTGQVLVINGNMHWSLFPWIGLKANNLIYYNPPSFTPKNFISAKEMDIKIKLIPLATGKIEISNVTLDNVILNLTKNKYGQFNWQNFAKSDKKIKEENDKPNQTIAKLTIESLKIKNGKLNWYDQQKNSYIKVTDLNIDSKKIQFRTPFPLALQLSLMDENDAKKLLLDVNSEISLSPDYQHFSFENLKIKGKYRLNNKLLNLYADGNLATNLQEQSMLSNFNFAFENLKGQLTLKGSNFNKKPHFSGILNTDDFNLKSFLENIGNPINTKNSNALKSVSLLGKVDMTGSSMQLTQLHAKINQTDIFGNINVASNQKHLLFNLTANDINLNDFLPNENFSSVKNDKKEEEKKKPQEKSPWQINGNIKITHFSADKFKLKDLNTTLSLNQNIIRMSPLRANLYSGLLEGSILIDMQQKNKKAIYIKQSIKNVNIKELFHEFSNSSKLTGITNVNIDLVSITDDRNNFLSALNGNINFTLTNGALHGVDIIYQLSRAHAFIKHLPSSSFTDSKRTEFAELKATAKVINGVANTQDLALTSDYLKVNGKGITNLFTKEIKYHLNALAQPKLAVENKQIGQEITIYQIPIKVSGKLNKPSVNLDFIEIAKLFLTKEIQKPISTHLTKDLNHLKDKVQEKIKDISPSKLLNKLTKTKDNKVNESNQL